MANQNPITPHQKSISRLASEGWMTRKFTAFIACLMFLEDITEGADNPSDGHTRAHLLFDLIKHRRFTSMRGIMPSVRKVAAACGLQLSTDDVGREFGLFQKREGLPIRLVPDAWRLGSPWQMSDGRNAAVLEVAEVGDSNPLFKDRLHKYALLDDRIQEYECGLALYEINATSGAVTEHDLQGMYVQADQEVYLPSA